MKRIILVNWMLLLFFLVPTKAIFADTIYACKITDETQFKGLLYLVGNTIPTCNPGHEVISWNQAGPGVIQFVYLGATTSKAKGDEGMGRFSQLCAEEVSPDSRLCTTKEVFQSINPFPTSLVEPIWVHPITVPGPLADYSGLPIGAISLSCSGWGSTDGVGFSLTGQGAADALPCVQLHQIACCGPAN